MDPLAYTQGMTENQRLLFQSEFNQRRKSTTAGVLLALFLGGIGAHRFYLGQVGIGIVYLVFCWTFIPAFVGFIEMFLMSGRVDQFNDQAAQDVALRIKILAGATT